MIEPIRSLSPFPTIDSNKKLYSGKEFHQATFCLKCDNKSCHVYLKNDPSAKVSHYICENKFSLFLIKFKSGLILINGVLDTSLNSECSSFLKKNFRKQKVSKAQIEGWCNLIDSIEEVIPQEIDRRVNENISWLHDIKTASHLILRNAEAIIDQLPGSTTEARIDSADPKTKALYKSVTLLNSRFQVLSIIANPVSASYGKRKKTPTHKIFTKFARMFEEIGHQKHVDIRLEGTSYNSPNVYDSFELIPLILIDNAIKYSLKYQNVQIIINDENRGVRVTVTSYGPVVSPEDQPNIFQKGFRTKEALTMTRDGSGLGLYIADIVAKANDFTISYKSANSHEIEGISTGNNIFEFYYK